MNHVIKTNRDRITQMSNTNYAGLDLCIVSNADISTMSATVQITKSGRVFHNVPFCLPAMFFDRGFIYLPEDGTLGILGSTNNQDLFIVGFLSFSGSDGVNEYVLPGEILIQSKGYAYIKEDNAGNVIIGSQGGNFISIGNKNDIIISSVTAKHATSARETISGIIKGAVAEIEKIYDKDISSSLSIEDIVENVLNNQDIPITKPSPIVIIERGNVIDENGNKLKLDINSQPEEMCYRISVKNNQNEDVLVLMVDKAGRVKASGKSLILDFDTFDYSACNNVIGK